MKKNLAKRIFMMFMAAFLLTGTVCAAAQVNTVTAQAAASQQAKVKKKADAIVKKQVKAKDSKKAKLKKLFVYTEKTYKSKNIAMTDGFDKWYKEKAYKGWEQDFALEMYSKGSGSCFHYAAAYAYLAKNVLGNKDKKNVRIALGKTNGFSGKLQDHAWTEVKIGSTWYVCDPTLDLSKAKKQADYGKKYFLKKRSDRKIKKLYNKYKNTKYVYVTL